MRLSSLRGFSQPSPVPAMPPGLVELMEGLTRKVLRCNPSDVHQFCANHMKKLLEIRDGPSHMKPLTLEQKIALAQKKVRQKAKERRERFDQQFKLQSDKSHEDVTGENIPDSSNSFDEPIIPTLKDPVRNDFERASEIEISQMQHGDRTSSNSPKAINLASTKNLLLGHDEGAEKLVDTNVGNAKAQVLNGSESVLSHQVLDESDNTENIKIEEITEKYNPESQNQAVLQTSNVSSSNQEEILELNNMITPESTPVLEYEVSGPENEDKNLSDENKINDKKEAEAKTIELTIPENTESIASHGISNLSTVEIRVIDSSNNENNNTDTIITNNENDKDTSSDDPISKEQNKEANHDNTYAVSPNLISSDTNKSLKIVDVKTSSEIFEKSDGGSSTEPSNDLKTSLISAPPKSEATSDKPLEMSNTDVTDSKNLTNQNNVNIGINKPTEKSNEEYDIDVNNTLEIPKDETLIYTDKTVNISEIENVEIRDQENVASNSKIDETVHLAHNNAKLPRSNVYNVENIQNRSDVDNQNKIIDNTLNHNSVSAVNNDTVDLLSDPQLELRTELVEERKIAENAEVENDDSNNISVTHEDSTPDNHESSANSGDKIEVNEEHIKPTYVQDLKLSGSHEKEAYILRDENKTGGNDNNDTDESLKPDGTGNKLRESQIEVKIEGYLNGQIKSDVNDLKNNENSAPITDITVKKLVEDQENGEENDENVNTDAFNIAVNLKSIVKDDEPIADHQSLNSSEDASKLQKIESTTEENIHSLKTDDSLQNNPNNMDLETAAVTIQKVFRSFMFKSRNSTFDDSTHDDSNSLDEDADKKEDYYIAANISKERRQLGITRMDTVLQTVNEEKSLSLSTDDSSTLSSAATTIQAHVRGFLVRSRRNSNKTVSTSSLVNSHEDREEVDQQKNKTILNIHIVPEEGHYLSRDESLITSMDLSLDGSPPSSVNLHPLSYDTSERRKMLKREDAVQSISPPSNNSGKLSEDSVKEILINDDTPDEPTDDTLKSVDQSNDLDNASDVVSESTSTITVINASEDSMKSPMESIDPQTLQSKMNSDEADVVTPYECSPRSDVTPRLEHSGEFHDALLPTKVSRADASVARGE